MIGCSESEPKLRIASVTWIGYEPLFYGQKLGLLPKNITITRSPNMQETLRAYKNGVIDIAATTLNDAITLIYDIPETVIFLITDYSNGGDMLISQQEIKSIKELKGKRVGMEISSFNPYILYRALSKEQMHLHDVDIVPILANKLYEKFSKAKIDAVISYGHDANRMIAKGEKLFDSSEIPYEIVDVLVARKSLIASHPKTFKSLIESWYDSVDAIQKNRKCLYHTIDEDCKCTPDKMCTTCGNVIFLNKEKTLAQLTYANSSFNQTVAKIKTFLKEEMKLNTRDNVQIIDQQLIREIYH